MRSPFRYLNSSPEMIRFPVMMYVRYPLSLRRVEVLLFERGIDVYYEAVRFWWNRFGRMFARPHSWRCETPTIFIAARHERRRSVTIERGRPWEAANFCGVPTKLRRSKASATTPT